jgi:tetratricopeptide (TPR) repeat protein
VRTEFEFGILGETIVHLHGTETLRGIGSRRQRQALAVLLTQPGRRMSFAKLVAWIWGEDEQPPRARESTFHTYAYRLRRTLYACGSQARLITENGGLRLDVEPSSIDYFLFRELVAKADSRRKEGDHEQAVELAGLAVGLWRDQPLAELASRPAQNWRRAVVQHEWIPANILLIDEQIALGRFDSALQRLDELNREHRPQARLVKRRLLVLHAAARYTEATDVFRAAYRRLRGEAEDEEAEELRKYHDRLKQRRAAITAPRHDDALTGPSPSPPRQLPRDISDFTGRQDLLRTLDELTGVRSGKPRSAVVTLSGLGGIGKTATVVRWARHTAAHFPAGVLFADLRGVSRTPRMEAGEVVDAFLAALGYPVEQIVGPAGRAERLRVLLEERPMLIILDNAQNSGHIRGLLPLFGDCVVVITSRLRLTELVVQHGIPSITVRPFDVGQSMELLLGRIGRRAAEAPEALRTLGDLCGGLPLALNLVADRAASRAGAPLRSLVDQLRDRETLLTIGNDGDGPDGSLQAIFSLSYDALSVETGRLFRLLGLHPGAEFGVEVAAALAGETPSATRRRLDELVGAHLVEQPGEVDRYRMHDLLLAYASSLADQDHESAQARQRMFSFYLHTAREAHRAAFPHALPPLLPVVPGAEPITFANDDEALPWCVRERANLNAVITYAAQLGDHGYAWRLPHATQKLLARSGFYADIVAGLSIAVSSAASEHNEEAEGSSLNDLGHFLLSVGDIATAGRHLERAMRIVDRLGAPVPRLTVMINLASKEHKLGNSRIAVQKYRDCLKIAVEIGDYGRAAIVQHSLGEVFAGQRRHETAAGHFERALALREQLGDTAGQVATLAELCEIFRFRGRHAAAEELGARARTLSDGVRDVSAEMRLYAVLAELQIDQGRFHEAAGFARRVLEVAEPTGSADAQAQALDLLGQASLRLGEREAARVAWRRSAEIFRGRGRDWQAASVDRRLAGMGAAPNIPTARRGVSSTEGHPIR